MRLFLAVDLPAKVKDSLDKQIEVIRRAYADSNWVSKENYHLTVYFFGETQKVKEIKKNIQDALYDQFSFHLYSQGIDVFINSKIIVYLNFFREKKLEELSEKIRKAFSPSSHNLKEFVPHLSLARSRVPSKQQYFAFKKRLEKLDIDIEFPVKEVILFQSILGGKKPTYKKIATFKLLQS